MRRNTDQPVRAPLKKWLQHYNGNWKEQSIHEQRGPDFHQRVRAEIVARVAARKARLDHIVDLRKRALEASARKWPLPRCHKHHSENLQRNEARRREEEARHAAENTRERVAAAARVEALMALRAAGARRRQISF